MTIKNINLGKIKFFFLLSILIQVQIVEVFAEKPIYFGTSVDIKILDNLNNNDNNEVFVFNGWTFASSPSIQVFDHPVYDLWILKCY